MLGRPTAGILRYGFAVLTILIALLVSTQIAFLQDRDLLMFMLLAVISSAWYGGLGPGVLATVVGALSTIYLFLPRIYSFNTATQEDLIQVGAFGAIAIVANWFIASRKRLMVALQASEGQFRRLNKELEQRVLERTRELEHANRILSARTEELIGINTELERFAYVSSHDLQEPLSTITSYLQLLATRYRDKLDTDADEFIGYAFDGAQRMERLIHDLLAYSQLGGRHQSIKQVDCECVWEQSFTHLKSAIEQSQAIVTHDSLPTIAGDVTQFVQLFVNLIDNALKFRLNNTPRVHMSATRYGGEWRFALQDNGIGIEPQYAERIFVVFQRLHTRAEYPGTGIGLAICKKIVESHGGRIWVESQPGQGATFYFTVPASFPEKIVPERSQETHPTKRIFFRKPSSI